jgi:hypothetical protein
VGCNLGPPVSPSFTQQFRRNYTAARIASTWLLVFVRERGVETRDSSRATIQWSRLELLHWSYKTI